MERKFYTDDFEQLLKEQTDDFRMYPSKRVWHSIYNEMHPGRKWPSIAVSMLLIFALLMIGYWNSNSSTALQKKLANVLPAPKNTAQIQYNNLNNVSNNTITATGSLYNVSPVAKVNGSNTHINSTGFTQYPITKVSPIINNNTSYFIKIINEENTISLSTGLNGNTATANIPGIKTTELNNNTAIETTANNNPEAVTDDNNSIAKLNTTEINTFFITAPAADFANTDATSKLATADKKLLSAEEKAWIDDYAFHNKSRRKKWHDRTASEIYITPSVGYRRLSTNTTASASTLNAVVSQPNNNVSLNNAVNQKPGAGLELGAGLVYSVAKNIRLKIGVQANFTNYIIHADATNHPTLTTVMFNNTNSGYPYMESRASELSNTSGFNPVKVHNTTYQIALPVGFALKLAGDNKLEWYAGATIQPTFVFAGKANLISFDRKNYVKDPTLIRQWNLNSGFETYIHYKFAGSTLQVGPQFRYQIGSTYSKKYSLNENLYNVGIKVGLIKNF
jgi:hypothetical protein